MTDPDVATTLGRELVRLTERVDGWSPGRWRAAASTGASRADVAYGLVVTLVELCRAAGGPVPDGAVPARLGTHALADQVRVAGVELLAALAAREADARDAADRVAAQALRAVTAARGALEGRPG